MDTVLGDGDAITEDAERTLRSEENHQKYDALINKASWNVAPPTYMGRGECPDVKIISVLYVFI